VLFVSANGISKNLKMMASQKLLNGLFVIPTEERDLNNIST